MKTIQGLQKGIDVLLRLKSSSGMSLHELHLATGYPKATLLRVIATLSKNELVWRANIDGLYRSDALVGQQSPATRKHYLLRQQAECHLKALCNKVIWPSDIYVRGKSQMLLIESSRKQSLLGTYGDTYGHPVDFLLSAAGRCYLAFCLEPERRKILASIPPPDLPKFLEILRLARERGYAVRHPDWHGQYGAADASRRRHTGISVPIMMGNRICACLNLLWVLDLVPEADMIRRHLSTLQATAEAIAADYTAAWRSAKARKNTGKQC